jgi:hypothetical protein
VSVLFGMALTFIGVVLGVAAGAVQGYFAGRTDLITQRLLEIWGSMPELYLLIIFSSIFQPSLGLLLVLLSLFGWMGLSDYVRADFCATASSTTCRPRAHGLARSPHHLASRAAQQHDHGGDLPAFPHECGHPGADQPGLPRPGGAAVHAQPG